MNESSNGGLLVYPAYFKVSVTAGNTYSLPITIENNSDIDVEISTKIGSFSQNQTTNQNYYEISDQFSNWFLTKDLEIPARDSETLQIVMEVPEDEELIKGSYFPAITLIETVKSNSAGPSVTLEHVIPVYVEVTSVSRVDAEIIEFEVTPFVLGTKSNISISFRNTGNTYFTPTSYIEFYDIDIFNHENKTRIESVPVSKGEPTLLPNSKISKTIDWQRDSFGKYEAKYTIMSENNELESVSNTFWIVPPRYIGYAIGIIMGFFVIVGIISSIIKRVKK